MSNSEGISQAEVDKAISTALAEITKAGSIAELKKAKGSILGDGSALAGFSARLGKLAADQKAEAGKIVGGARAKVTEAFEAREHELSAVEEAKLLEKEAIDVTALGRIARTGARHPLSLLQEKISDVFVGMGWEIAEGPEVESEWFNFDALNFDADHPARAMQDTFFVEPTEQKLVLRTHTSPVQVRSMLDREVPIYVLCPGRVFRTDELDATHTPVFHQVEGLAIDKGLSMANLRGTLEHFARIMFGEEAKIRLRPSFFPFTEPSAELDVWHPGAKGGARWVEWGGCGMVNPNVLRASGIDPEVYSGFAFGMGIERTLMFRNEVSDMHDMVEGDVRFSQQFGMVL
ncbi:MAG: phenylalanine--tRNA ligase subunit alpha [Actinobacteria bacterium]|jgi:phenylalanyl-tRNA synthetase alpha chain|uniref:Phenylalanine--tRNA ligase alpha subunit n=2 Tax=freshwater metagenome TaxID=449393 RepID=A0A6J6LQZ9_9ZZZZ|nr:phenylalanine--tRNA ligase subunit alpha [Actinomycetota bacterium]